MVQPSEFAKLATIVFLASLLADRKAWPTGMKPRKNAIHWLDTILVPKLVRTLPGIGVLISILLIEHGKDLGTAAVVAVIAFVMFIMAGVSRKSLVFGVVLAICGCVLMVMKEPYRMDRVTNHLQRWSRQNVDDVGYQTVQSELGMAAGGVLGVGIGNGRTKHVLPATTTDFIMATVGEEFGLLGSLFVLAAVGSIVWRMFYLAQRVKSRYAMLVLGGVAVWFGFQACVNVMMANGFLPAIGIPLPFISSGGSSLIALWLAIGVCQSSLAPSPAKEEAVAPSSHRWRDGRTHLSSA
jgi:cell division protein FtsW